MRRLGSEPGKTKKCVGLAHDVRLAIAYIGVGGNAERDRVDRSLLSQKRVIQLSRPPPSPVLFSFVRLHGSSCLVGRPLLLGRLSFRFTYTYFFSALLVHQTQYDNLTTFGPPQVDQTPNE